MSFANKVTTGTYNLASLIVKLILLASSISLSLPDADKTQYFVHCTVQLTKGIYTELQKLLKYFNDSSILEFVRIPSAALSG